MQWKWGSNDLVLPKVFTCIESEHQDKIKVMLNSSLKFETEVHQAVY